MIATTTSRRRKVEPFHLEDDPLWYKDALIYEMHVRSFMDSDADGSGDFRGLIEKLPYLQDLGVNALWLLPFYPSPLRDDGYDIADYTNVNPMYGTLGDISQLVKDAHSRRNCRDLNGTEPWACSNCDCTKKLEERLRKRGKAFLEELKRHSEGFQAI